jgi:(p)ppGpp synthase/HD superfamily hydrolase
MMSVEGEETQIVAVLHDVIEDTPVTADDLQQAGFSEKIIAAVRCVTHRKGEPYVIRCKSNEVARRAYGYLLAAQKP